MRGRILISFRPRETVLSEATYRAAMLDHLNKMEQLQPAYRRVETEPAEFPDLGRDAVVNFVASEFAGRRSYQLVGDAHQTLIDLHATHLDAERDEKGGNAARYEARRKVLRQMLAEALQAAEEALQAGR